MSDYSHIYHLLSFKVVSDYEYVRSGVCNVFMASKPLAGMRMTKVTERNTKVDWAQFLQEIAEHYQAARKITLVMDNLNTHSPGALYEAFPPDKAKALWGRFELSTHQSTVVGSTSPRSNSM